MKEIISEQRLELSDKTSRAQSLGRAFQLEEIANTKAQRLDLFDVFGGPGRRPVCLAWSCVLPPSPHDHGLGLDRNFPVLMHMLDI